MFYIIHTTKTNALYINEANRIGTLYIIHMPTHAISHKHFTTGRYKYAVQLGLP